MLFSLNLSSWQITPHGYSVDSAAHYALVRFLYDYKHLPGSDWSFLWEIAHYPFGFHLTTAILSTLIGVSPFYVMWIFSAFLMGVVVASVCTMVFSDLRPRKTFAFIASVWSFAMFVVSPYVMESYSISGFYPMVLGLVFIAMFVWCLRIITELTKGLVFFVTIAFAGMGLTYPQWLPILYLLYIYLVYTRPNAIGVNKIIALAIPLLASAIIGLGFAAQHWAGLKYIYNIEGGVPKDLRYIALLLLGSSLLIFSTSYHKQQRDYLFVLFILILQVGLVVVSKKLAGLGGLYPMYKYAYVLTPIFILVLAQEYQCDNKLRKYANYKLAVPILILLASGINAYHMHSLLRPSPAYLKVNEYHVLKWVAKNTVNKSVAYMGEAPFPLFGYAITGKAQFHGEFGWWVQPTIQLEAWEEQASKGEVAILLHVKDGEGKQFDHAKFQVLYKEGDCVAIQKV
jgi:MFS family permease